MANSIGSNENDNEITVTATNHIKDYPLDIEKIASTITYNEKQINTNQLNDNQNTTSALERIFTSGMDEASIIDPPPNDLLDEIPDGGYGWVITVAGFFAYLTVFGEVGVWGIFTEAYATGSLKGKASTLELMTVGSVVNVCINVFSPISVLLVRFGTRFNYGLGGLLAGIGLILAGFSTEVWHLYLTQGVLFGFGCSFLYMAIAAVIPQWFSSLRGTAMGLCTAGTGIGGLALSPLTRYLIDQYGTAWAYRVLGFIALGVGGLGTILVKDRVRISYRKNKQPIKSPIKLSMFKMVDFNIWLVGAVVSLLGYLGPIFFLPKYAADVGLSTKDASNLLSILLALGAVSRLILGFVADKIGRLNMFIICTALSGVFSFVIWPFATSFNILLVFCILWGATSGTYYVLAAPITASVVGMDRLSSGLSILFITSSIAAMGTPISAAIQQATPDNGYIGIQMFTGAAYVLGAMICLYLKYRLTGSLLAKY